MKWPLFKSLQGRLLVILLALTVLPALLIGVLAYHNARQQNWKRLRAKAQNCHALPRCRSGNIPRPAHHP